MADQVSVGPNTKGTVGATSPAEDEDTDDLPFGAQRAARPHAARCLGIAAVGAG